MTRPSCECGGVCFNNPERCAFNARQQRKLAAGIEQRRASMHALPDPGDDNEAAVGDGESASEAIALAMAVRI